MPPAFRASRSGRQFGEGNRSRIDHDVFEGLPVRRWSRQPQTISQAPKTEGQESLLQGPGGEHSIPEHPMPRDSHLLTPMSRALLRAARAGCIYIRHAAKDSEDEEKDATDVEEQQATQNLMERKFVLRKWAAVPRHLEPSEVEFLAKRRPGLPSLYGAAAGAVDGAAAPMRRTRFKKVDPASGNISIYEAWVPEGLKIDGEITNENQLVAESTEVTVTPEAPVPGTVIDGVGVVNSEGVVVAEAGSVSVLTPPKRRPPPPKRKAKGFGKGRRKKVMFAPGEGADASTVHGADGAADGATGTFVKEESADPSRLSVDQAGQDDEEEDGEEGEESDEGDESMVEPKTPETPLRQSSAEPAPEPAPAPAPAAPTQPTDDAKPSNPPPLPSALEAAPELPPTTSADASASPEKPAQDDAHADEDVEMADVKPQPPAADPPSSMAQPRPEKPLETLEAEKPAPQEAAPPQPQGHPEVPAKEPSPAVKTEHDAPGEPALNALDGAADSGLGDQPAHQDENMIVDTSVDQTQPSLEQAQKPELDGKQEKLEEKETDDILGSLEASLGGNNNAGQGVGPSGEQAGAEPEALADQANDKITDHTMNETKPVDEGPAAEQATQEPPAPSTEQATETAPQGNEQPATEQPEEEQKPQVPVESLTAPQTEQPPDEPAQEIPEPAAEEPSATQTPEKVEEAASTSTENPPAATQDVAPPAEAEAAPEPTPEQPAEAPAQSSTEQPPESTDPKPEEPSGPPAEEQPAPEVQEQAPQNRPEEAAAEPTQKPAAEESQPKALSPSPPSAAPPAPAPAPPTEEAQPQPSDPELKDAEADADADATVPEPQPTTAPTTEPTPAEAEDSKKDENPEEEPTKAPGTEEPAPAPAPGPAPPSGPPDTA